MADKLIVKIKPSSFTISPQTKYVAAASKIKVNRDSVDDYISRNALIGGIPRQDPRPNTYKLTITLDSISNSPVNDPSKVGEWNTFFNTNKFIYATVTDNTIVLESLVSTGNYGVTLTQVFRNNTHIIGFVDEGSIISMYSYAFSGCTNLEVVSIGKSIGVPSYGFENCTSLTSFNVNTIEQSNFSISNNAFINAKIPSNFPFSRVSDIGNYAFSNTTGIVNLTLSVLSSMGSNVFENADSVVSVNILNTSSLNYIPSYCFYGCNNLQSFIAPNITSVQNNAFQNCTSLSDVRITQVINLGGSLGESSFFNCSSLTSIYFPNIVTISNSCFEGCTSVSQIILPTAYNLGSTFGDNRVFFGITGKNMPIVVNPAVLINNTGGTPDGDLQYLTTNNTISEIFSNFLQLSFDTLSSMSSLVPTYTNVNSWNTLFNLPSLGSSFTSVGLFTGSFEPFVALKGASGVTLKSNLFEGVTGLTSAIDGPINNGPSITIVTSIQDSVFKNCTGLKIFLFKSAVSIGNGAFQGCTNVDLATQNAYLSNIIPSARSLGNYCFESFGANLPYSTSDYLSANLLFVTSIGEYCFSNSRFYTFNLYSLVSVPNYAFENCSKTDRIYLASANIIGDGAFAGCTTLNELNLQYVGALGSTTGNNGVFANISGSNINLNTIQSDLFIANNGYPDGDLVYLQANNALTITSSISYPAGLSMTFASSGSALSFFGGSITTGSINTKFNTVGTAIPFDTINIFKLGRLIIATGGGGIDIPDNLFKNNTDIIAIKDTTYNIVNIGSEAFSGCTNLISASFTVAVNYGSASFKDCTSLSNTDFRYMHIASASAFENCTSITTFAGRDFKYAGDKVFKNTTSATTFNYPALVQVGDQCFSGSNNITTLNIPSLATIGSTTGNNEVFSVTGKNIALTITGSSLTDGDVVYLTSNNTITLDEPALILTFDSTGSVQALVANTGSVANWNTFFNLPTYGTPFTSVQVTPNVPIYDTTQYAPQEYGCQVKLYGGKNMTIAPNRFNNYRKLRKLVDNGSTVVRVGYSAFYQNQNWWNNSSQNPSLYGIMEISLPACTYLEATAFYGNMSTYRLNLPSVQYFGGNSVLWSTMAWYGSYSPVIENYSRVEDQIVSLPNLISVGTGMLANSYRVSSINVPQQTSIPLYSFAVCTSAYCINIPKGNYSGQQFLFQLPVNARINMPNMTNLGGTVGFDNIWGYNQIPSGGTYRIPASLYTVNSGNPDGDLQSILTANAQGSNIRIITT